mgnify:CR=1 FL=1
MAEQTGGRIKVVLRWVQILDKMEPAWKEKGEFRFTARVSTENGGGVVKELRFPEQGHYDISDHPAWNKVVLNRTIFEGEIDDRAGRNRGADRHPVELAVQIRQHEADGFRRAGGGRKSVSESDPELVPELKRLVEPATQGDPSWQSQAPLGRDR